MLKTDFLTEAIRSVDSRVSHVDVVERVGAVPESALLESPVPVLIAAIAAAARGAAVESMAPDDGHAEDERKRRIDGAATEAAERVFVGSRLKVEVAAGEGLRDQSPGARAGQLIQGAHASEKWAGVFDYVDGTTLAARRLPGALSLGSLGRGYRSVPDLQAYSVQVDAAVASGLNVMSPPEEHIIPLLEALAGQRGISVGDLTIFTHSVSSNQSHATLIDILRQNVAQVVVPELVTVEPPALLSQIGLSGPRVDSMIGAMGLSELAFAATLLDLALPDSRFLFRVASIDGPRAAPETPTLEPMFSFSEHELEELRNLGWQPDLQYTSRDIVPAGSAKASAIFAVTCNKDFGLPAPVIEPMGDAVVHGYVLVSGCRVARVTVTYSS
ncbi:hypothetical protein Cs7R123_31230 [Catellatospora sp. TT07R-123]|uniref:fructose-bisphosphatase class II n=1 Tax=Catellatospora sp. TT07R-123 TaxID=2733863 RepID=UPI001B22286C|nr:fructose-bisphosphatase class II [Catellatospora sp. TT07R-123]GHJ45781.1 hypothetical protein Cs7R123_31230 [Catellatospora sp. TT07R-123]